MKLHPRAGTPWLFALPLLAFGLRVFRLDYQELRGDETFGFFFSQHTWGEIIRQSIANKEPHPVASYFVQNAWLRVAGQSEFALRFTSAWFSVLAVAVVYRLARRLGLSRVVSAAGGGLLAISPYAIWHAQDARMYSTLLALIVASAWLALEALARPRLRYWLAYVAVTGLALHTHYSAAFMVITENIFVIAWALACRQGRLLLRWLGSQVALLGVFAPWLALIGRDLSVYSGNGDSPGWAPMIYRSLSALAFGETVPAAARPGYAALAGALVIVGLIALFGRRPGAFEIRGGRPGSAEAKPVFALSHPGEDELRPYDETRPPQPGNGFAGSWAGPWLALALFVPLGITWLGGASRPIFNERYLVAAVPPFCVLLAVGVTALAQPLVLRLAKTTTGRWRAADWAAVALLGLSAAAVFGSLGGYYTDPAYSKTRGWRALAAEFRRLSAGLPAERVRVAQNYPDPTLWYYYTGPAEHTVLPPAADDETGARQEVAALAGSGVEWVLLAEYASDAWDPSGIAATALGSDFLLADRRTVGVWPVDVFVRADAAGLRQVGAAFANGVTLSRASTTPATVSPNGLLLVNAAWTGEAAALQGSEKVFVHLADAAGRPVAQSDQPLTAGQLQGVTTYVLHLPAQLAAGEYHILTGIYDAGRPGAPRLTLADGGDHVDLGAVQCRDQGTDAQP